MKLPEKIDQVKISAFGNQTGNLSQPAQFSFEYTGDTPISLTMNTREKPYQHGAIHPVFAQNLPEGYIRRYIHEKLLRYAKVNDIYLLALQSDKGR